MKTCLHCGCLQGRHEHYRVGTDCGRCGRLICPRFKARRWWHRNPPPTVPTKLRVI